jgi:hypothetical protein
MLHRIFLFFSIFMIPVWLLVPLDVQSDSADPEEVAHIKAGHKKVEGVVADLKSGLYTFETATGATLTLAESAFFRYGHDAPKIGDKMTLWVNEGNLIIDAHPKGQPGLAHHFSSGTLKLLDYAQSRMTLSTSEGERDFKLKPESRMFKEIPVGSQVTIELNETGEVIDLHNDNPDGSISNALSQSK